MIEKVWLCPPLAFGRLGPSATPCDNFGWGPNDLSPRGSGKTTVHPAETLDLDASGGLTSRTPAVIVFKDAAGFRPVCPFFELHGTWQLDGTSHEGPITRDVLASFGLQLTEVRWQVHVANHKPFHYTLVDDDRIDAVVEIAGDDTTRKELQGASPAGAAQPLVPVGQVVPLGWVQVAHTDARFPELRMRFTPAAGLVYGPTNLPSRSDVFVLPAGQLRLNPAAAWCSFALTGDDPRTNPGGLFAGAEENESLGLVDDVCDGLIRCEVPGVAPAIARIVVGPPDFAPDRRPFNSIADGLADRVRRADVWDPAFIAEEALTSLEIRDLFERVLETMDNINVDAQNDRARFENQGIAAAAGLPIEQVRDRAFIPPSPLPGRPLPLTEAGRQKHRRFLALEVIEDLFREQPDLITRVIREPMTGERYYDRTMPATMRGSDRHPLHLTRRQYDLIRAWAERLHANAEAGT